MSRIITWAVLGVIAIVFVAQNFINPFSHTQTQDVSGTQKLLSVEPITLDCRAVITASVPVKISQTHKMYGVTYRTDTASMDAIGDIDVCVDVPYVQYAPDGTVIIPSAAIVMHRPRVDTVATLGSLEYDQGFAGEVGDLFPGVSDDDGAVAALYAYAQSAIADSSCIAEAYIVASEMIVEAYDTIYGIKARVDPQSSIRAHPFPCEVISNAPVQSNLSGR